MDGMGRRRRCQEQKRHLSIHTVAPSRDAISGHFSFSRPSSKLTSALRIENDPVEILTVNLISGSEYRFIKEKGLNAFLDMLDEEYHPPIFDPKRKSHL
ncbi:suppressor of fused domain protein [Rhizobium brockwellii]